MATQPVPVPLSVEQLVEAIKQLSPAELREFRRQFTAWQEQNGQQAEDETALRRAAQAHLPATVDRRLKRLIAKSEQGALTPKELADYQTLTQQAEQINVMRAAARAELARRSGKPAPVVMAETAGEGGADGP